MTAITIPLDIQLTPRSRAIMEALGRALDPRFVDTDDVSAPAEAAAPPVSAVSAPVAPGTYWPEHDAWYAGLQATPGGRLWHVLVPKAHVEALKEVQWGRYGTIVDGASDMYDGLANTQAMVDAGLELAEKVMALGEGLYLPSRAEALLMFSSLKDQIGDGVVWTSTQYSADTAWSQYFGSGYQRTFSKVCEFRAVPVRRLFL